MLEGCTPWPAATGERYRALGYWRGETLGEMPGEWARRFGERVALVHRDQRLSYRELGRRVERMAAGFQRRGIAPGDRVVVQLPNIPEFVIVCFALFRMGAKPVFALPAHRASEVGHLCTVSGAVAYVIPGVQPDFDYAALAAEIMASSQELRCTFVVGGEVPGGWPAALGAGTFVALDDVDGESSPESSLDPSDVAFFLISGGTTALPKLIPRTHDDYAYQTRAAAGLLGLSQDDVYLAVLPVAFNFTWGCPGVVGTLRSGGTVILAESPDPADCFATIDREQVTFTSLVPSLALLWLEGAEDTPFGDSSLELVQIGGAPLARSVAERVTPAFGCRLQQVFGMAEGLLTFTREDDPPESVVATQGRPLSPADEVRIVDDDGQDLSPGHTGQLLTRGPYTLRGYYRAPQHNAGAFTDDGFYRTGDLARLTDASELVIDGRIKDIIIRGGSKVSAAEVEEHLMAHPAVDRVAVVPVPDPYVGERICAYVRPRGTPPSLASLRKALHERGLASYKLPDRLEIIDDLPLTGLGKVDKKLLAKDAAARTAQDS